MYELIDDYYNTLCANGQAISGFEVYSNDGSIFVTIVLPQEDSLLEANGSIYVKERLKTLQEIFEIEIIREGTNLEYHHSCVREKLSSYILYNEGNLGESPLICGDRQQPVPLYLLPYLREENDHYLITQWQRAKNAMDSL